MKIVCPQCHFSKNIDPASIPNTALMVTCPKCKTRFPFTPGKAEQDDDFAFLNSDSTTSPGANQRLGKSENGIKGQESSFRGR